jgi:hypothetical protein
MTPTPWTRLEGTSLWSAAEKAYVENGHAYHALDHHIRGIYRQAQALDLPYDLHLDRAILAHDVILDDLGNNELRSADWLDDHLEAPDASARKLILTTIDHATVNPDRRMALLDLIDFTDQGRRRLNTRLLLREAERRSMLRGQANFDQPAWVMGALTYLKGLHGRVEGGLADVPDERERDLWRRISRGIAVTMATMPFDYAPHPASCIRRYTRGMETTLRILTFGPPLAEPDILDVVGSSLSRGLQGAAASLRALSDEGLIEKRVSDGAVTWEATGAGRDWVTRMDAPQIDWPEPGFA